MKPSDRIRIILLLLSCFGVLLTPRSDFYQLFAFYTVAFACYVKLALSSSSISFFTGCLVALMCRVLACSLPPFLSDDYFRFIWDGMIMHQGINPVAYTPAYLMSHPEIVTTDPVLFSFLNSPDYYSVYPPVAQLIYYLSFAINHLNFGGHVIFLKLIAISADGLIILLLWKLLKQINLPVNRALIYALNPLIIVEYTGNLHMEGIMIAFLLAAIWLSTKKQKVWSAIMMAMSISSKMVTLILLPFISKDQKWNQIFLRCLLTLIISTFLFWLSFGFYPGWIDSVMLWFRSFEFNASLYYIVRGIDMLWRGYNNIQITGPVMGLITFIIIGIIGVFYIRKKDADLPSLMIISLTIYFLMSTTVHPWYLGTLVALCVISRYRFPIVWSFLVFLSYSHYEDGGFREDYLLIATEYILLFLWMFFELRTYRILNSE